MREDWLTSGLNNDEMQIIGKRSGKEQGKGRTVRDTREWGQR